MNDAIDFVKGNHGSIVEAVIAVSTLLRMLIGVFKPKHPKLADVLQNVDAVAQILAVTLPKKAAPAAQGGAK